MTARPRYRRFVVSGGVRDDQLVVNIACSRVWITVNGLDRATRDALVLASTDEAFNAALTEPLASAMTKVLVGLALGDLP